jgi:hypothetical protein
MQTKTQETTRHDWLKFDVVKHLKESGTEVTFANAMRAVGHEPDEKWEGTYQRLVKSLETSEDDGSGDPAELAINFLINKAFMPKFH